MIKTIHFLEQWNSNRILVGSFCDRPLMPSFPNKRGEAESNNSLFFLGYKVGKNFLQNWNNMRARLAPLVLVFTRFSNNLIPNRTTKGFSNKFNGLSVCHSNLYHWDIKNLGFVFPINFTNTNTALSVNNARNISINSFHNYNVSYYRMYCQERKIN